MQGCSQAGKSAAPNGKTAGETMSTSTDTVRRIESLPCYRCQDPRGADLRHALAQSGGVIDENQVSPYSRLPLGCCKIRSTPILSGR
jgi:hypothetical protein